MREFEWDTGDLADQGGRTVVVTGASSGVGLEVTKSLVRAGATVIAGVRNVAKMSALIPRLTDGLDGGSSGRVEARPLDVSDLRSIDAFAAELAGDGVALGALVNNAGISASRFALSRDGVELTYATNLVGAAWLAERVLPQLTGPDPRVVLVGSNFSQRTQAMPDLGAVGDPARFRQLAAYRGSKIAAAAYAVDLGERLAAAGSPVRSVIAHPGVAATAMAAQADNVVTKAIAAVVLSRLARPADDAARSVIWSATSRDVVQGVFVGPALRRRDRRLHVVPVRGGAADPAFRARVRDFVQTATGESRVLGQ
ncbi:SDR family NAD(P)-dependent oxidoreductase [Rhizomonospora bruguierae]|uniref:SDR family NAD(P)-dependent oxidoreductase n=1 Tax=Rhizomonospora bruguierae TaxID=1581705 RepID=UPI001BCAF7B6|nr:SDR family NAD(P)-dependent oxidoreductase [Micromonospora sp. NBRC 107566]